MLKRALRSVYDTGFCSQSSPLFARLGLDRLASMYCKEISVSDVALFGRPL